MGWLNEFLNELWPTYWMYCKDCKKMFITKKSSLLGSDMKTIDMHCTHCGGTNTNFK